jgi:glycosyltransferase involved in cell wall biosynthesis
MLDPPGVRHWMRQCDVFVLPSLQETFGIVLGEAMSCGRPVIATRCGGPEFVVTPETGILVDAADPAALADAMQHFIQGKGKFDPEKIRQSVKDRFSTEAFLDTVTAVYEQVWSGHRGLPLSPGEERSS